MQVRGDRRGGLAVLIGEHRVLHGVGGALMGRRNVLRVHRVGEQIFVHVVLSVDRHRLRVRIGNRIAMCPHSGLFFCDASRRKRLCSKATR